MICAVAPAMQTKPASRAMRYLFMIGGTTFSTIAPRAPMQNSAIEGH
jgi:hypothetical protein